MAANTVMLMPSNNSDSLWRAWCKEIHDQMAAGGFVQTADTGQADWDTSTAPTGSGEKEYEVWRTDQSGDGLSDWYVRIGYGEGSSTDSPVVCLTIGWGSDGSGNLTGNTCDSLVFGDHTANGHSESTTIACNFSLDGTTEGRLCMSLWTNGPLNANTYVIHRVRNTDGTLRDEVVIWHKRSSVAPNINQVVPKAGNVSTKDTTSGGGFRFVPSTIATYGSDKGVGSFAPCKGSYQMESDCLLAGNSTDFSTQQQQYSFMIYGATKTFILTGGTSHATTGHNLLMRFD